MIAETIIAKKAITFTKSGMAIGSLLGPVGTVVGGVVGAYIAYEVTKSASKHNRCLLNPIKKIS
jgi:hypothetical protein